jgi:hypothetical protein
MSIEPTSGTTVGGTRVTITGVNLARATAVRIGGAPVSSLAIVDANTITAITPANSAGRVDVAVLMPGGGTEIGTGLYTYVSPLPLGAIVGGVLAAGAAVGIAALAGGGTDPAPPVPGAPASPTVTSINPPAGPTMGGTSVVIKAPI